MVQLNLEIVLPFLCLNLLPLFLQKQPALRGFVEFLLGFRLRVHQFRHFCVVAGVRGNFLLQLR